MGDVIELLADLRSKPFVGTKYKLKEVVEKSSTSLRFRGEVTSLSFVSNQEVFGKTG